MRLWSKVQEHQSIHNKVMAHMYQSTCFSRIIITKIPFLENIWGSYGFFLGGGVRRGGEQKGCIPGCSFLLNAYLRTLFRFYVSGKTSMSRFYYPNVVGKGQQVKMQRRGPVLTPTVILTSNMSKLSLCISGARENLCSVRPNLVSVV